MMDVHERSLKRLHQLRADLRLAPAAVGIHRDYDQGLAR